MAARVKSGRLGRLDGHFVAKPFELADEPAGVGLVGVALEEPVAPRSW